MKKSNFPCSFLLKRNPNTNNKPQTKQQTKQKPIEKNTIPVLLNRRL